MSTRLTHIIAVSFLLSAACSFEESAPPPGGWNLGGDDMTADQSNVPDNGVTPDMSLTPDMGEADLPIGPDMMQPPADMSVMPDMPDRPDMMQPPADMAPDMLPEDMGQDMNQPDMSTGLDMGTAMTGEACGRNAECSAGLVCCIGLGGGGECQPQAMCLGGRFGGLCEVDAECPGQVCCEINLGGFGQNVRACQDMCGGINLACMNNADCGMGDVCCPGARGAECKPRNQCFTGGLCMVDADCQGQQKCCSFAANIPSVCLDRCSF
jgi:hypothetical protein